MVPLLGTPCIEPVTRSNFSCNFPDNSTRGGSTGECGSGTPPPPLTRQRVGKWLFQLAKVDWLMITLEQTEMDNIPNIWQKNIFILSILNPKKLNISQI